MLSKILVKIAPWYFLADRQELSMVFGPAAEFVKVFESSGC